MKKLPISIQSFSKLRTEDCVYVDKTELIHSLVQGGGQYFLSRPRRFGKSMTIATIKEIFEGNKALFEGLWIYDKWDWTKTNPVIHIQFARLAYKELGLENELLTLMQEIGKAYGIQLKSSVYTSAFDELIKSLSKIHGRVVILIDEYDKPINDFLELKNREKSIENREKLRDFYRCVKDNDENIEFFFMTGVSRFSQTGVFSHLNHLNDITMGKKYATLVGYTPEELLHCFEDRIQKLLTSSFDDLTKTELMDEVRSWYNGYSWDGKQTVYNPFSILNFFEKEEFQDYWFKSGAPKFLIDLIKEKKIFNFSNIRATGTLIDSYDIENIEVRTLLFQTGYLTVKHFDNRRGLYTLDYPNREVEQALSNYIIGLMTNVETNQSAIPILNMENAFLKNDIETVVKVIKSLLKDVPYYLIEDKNEHFYHALVHLHFRYLGWFMESEVHTSDGRMDAVVKTDSHIYILEFKIDKTADVALQQIKNKQYADKYLLDNKEIIAVGINFDTDHKTVDDWKMEVIKQ